MNNYTKTNWVNGSAPALSADNLNKIENGIENATEALINIESEVHAARGSYQNLKARLDDTGAPTDEQVAEAVEEYLEEHPPVGNFEIVANKKESISNRSQTGDRDKFYPTVGAVRDFVDYVKGDLEDYVDDELSGKADKATTLAGYGITNAYTKTEVNGMIPTVPTKVSDLSNDSGFLTLSTLPKYNGGVQ